MKEWLDFLKCHGPTLAGWVVEFFTKKPRLLFVGGTGVGKSSLIESVKYDLSEAIDRMTRTNLLEPGTIKQGDLKCETVDTPGHRVRDDRTLPNPSLENAIASAKKRPFAGIINVVAYGYHEYDLDPVPDLVNPEVLESFLKDHRERELVALETWGPEYALIGHAPFIMTVVTKADLWYDHEKVSEWYESGEYFDKLLSVTGQNADKLQHIVLPMSSHREMFYGKVPMSGYYVDDTRMSARANLIETLVKILATG